MTIGEVIYKYRKKAGISQEELADTLGVTRQSVSLWETDQTLPSTANLVRLTEIFNITMDELCGKQNKSEEQAEESDSADLEEQEKIVERNNQSQANSNIIAECSAQFTKPLLNSMYLKTASPFIWGLIILVAISVVWIASVLITKEAPVATVTAPCIILGLCVCTTISTVVRIKLNIDKSLKLQPNHRNKVRFYCDHFEVDSISDNSNMKYSKSYSEIKSVKCTKDYIFIRYDNVFTPIIKENLGEYAQVVAGVLKIDSKEITDKNSVKIKRALLAMFILSIASIWIALLATVIGFSFSPIPEFGNVEEYMWIFYLIIPIPLSSAILGIVYLTKNYKCKKNVIAGFIMTFFLAIYGSFTPVMAGDIKHDFNFVNEIERVLPIDLPDSGYITYKNYTVNASSYVFAMAKFENAQEMTDIVSNGNWKNNFNEMPSDLIIKQAVDRSKEYDAFYLYDIDCQSNLEITENGHTGHKCVYLAYSLKNNLLQIWCFTV